MGRVSSVIFLAITLDTASSSNFTKRRWVKRDLVFNHFDCLHPSYWQLLDLYHHFFILLLNLILQFIFLVLFISLFHFLLLPFPPLKVHLLLLIHWYSAQWENGGPYSVDSPFYNLDACHVCSGNSIYFKQLCPICLLHCPAKNCKTTNFPLCMNSPGRLRGKWMFPSLYCR